VSLRRRVRIATQAAADLHPWADPPDPRPAWWGIDPPDMTDAELAAAADYFGIERPDLSRYTTSDLRRMQADLEADARRRRRR
jgi:hypothetical protein